MTNQEILEKAVHKAEANGFKVDYASWMSPDNNYYFSSIFSHEFAEAFWGSKRFACTTCGFESDLKEERLAHVGVTHHYGARVSWQYHLQQMVLEEKPLKYLEQFLS